MSNSGAGRPRSSLLGKPYHFSYGHLLRSSAMGNLARYLRHRFIQSKQMQDKEELFNLYVQLVRKHQIASSADLAVTRTWIRVAEEFQHPTLLLAYETSLRLTVQHLATLPSLPQHLGILKNLTSSLAVDASSICLSRHTPAHAVELLEQSPRNSIGTNGSTLRVTVSQIGHSPSLPRSLCTTDTSRLNASSDAI